MKIGFSNIFSFRPHVEHLYFLSKVVKDAGHEICFLTCDSSVDTCYARELKNSSKVKECAKCMLGGVRSFTNENITSIKKHDISLNINDLDTLSLSSSCTLTRTESEEEWYDPDVVNFRKKLHKPISDVYESAKKWIKDNNLDAVICFNGRMDLTRGLTKACEDMGIPYITHERTWFGDGLRLIPNGNCLSIQQISKIVKEFSDKPLHQDQANYAGKLIGERFLQKNSLEWRLYNKNPIPIDWPRSSHGKKILILPSSKNEFSGNEEYTTEWYDNTKALDDYFEVFNISSDQVVLRCHPNWSENIGSVQGNRCLNLYKAWAAKRGIYCINSDEKANTYDLIQQADIVILNGGSSAVEAGACGKEVICLSSSGYQLSGFVKTYCSKQDMLLDTNNIDANSVEIMRKTLRYLYSRSHRFPQFVNQVKAVETTKYKYYQGADVERLLYMLEKGEVIPNDASYSNSIEFEDNIINMLLKKDWGALSSYEHNHPQLKGFDISRKKYFRWVDSVRNLFSRGDR